jgi:hypothetical protein
VLIAGLEAEYQELLGFQSQDSDFPGPRYSAASEG